MGALRHHLGQDMQVCAAVYPRPPGCPGGFPRGFDFSKTSTAQLVNGQLFTDPDGVVWEYAAATRTWSIVPAATPPPPTNGAASWLDQEMISGIPNKWLLLGAGVAALLFFGGER